MQLIPPGGVTRSLAFAAVVNTFGNGLYLVLSALFFTRIVGLSAANVGLGLSGAALVGLAASTPMGYLADRFGPRNLAVGWFAAQSVAQVAMVFAHSYLWFLVVIVLDRLIDAGARGAWGAVMANAVPEDQRLRTRAYLRSATNLSITVGVLVAGVALTADTRSWYVGMFLANAVTTMLAALILLRVPTIPPVPKPANGPRLGSLRDRPFLTFTVVDGLLSMHYVVVEFAVPLWVVSATGVPRWTVSVLGIINTVMCFLFQTRAAKGADQIAAAARRSRWAGFAVAGACVLYAAAAGRPTWLAVVLLVLGTLVHVAGELWQAVGGWGISFGLAPKDAQGQYQATYSMGNGLARTLAPTVLSLLVIGWGRPGWLLLAVVFACCGSVIPPSCPGHRGSASGNPKRP